MTERRRQRVRVLLLLAAGVLVASRLPAQSNDPIQARTQLNFSNPGARSLGMAGAFTARADDATAVYANPAGLVQLTQAEVSVDTRGWRFRNRVIDGGAQLAPDSAAGIGFSLTDDRLTGVSFLSAFYPKKRWAAGVFRHQMVRFRSEIHSDSTALATGGIVRPVDGLYEANVDNLGVALALRLGERVALGASLGQARFELRSRIERWCKPRSQAGVPICPASDTAVLASPFGNSPEDILLYWTQDQDGETDLALNAGFLWQSARRVEGVPVLSLGAVYRRGPEFSFQAQMIGKDRGTRDFISRISPTNPPPGCSNSAGCRGVFKVPDTTGIGISLRPALRWVVALDVNRVEYSDLLDQALDSLGVGAGGQGALLEPGLFRLDDGNEYRAGVEYALIRERRLPDIFLRAGVWSDPDHKMRYEGASEQLGRVFVPGDDELHWAGGVGLRYRRFQVDAAFDLSARIDTVSVAAIYYLGRR